MVRHKLKLKKKKNQLGLQKPRPAQKRQILQEQGTRPTKADRHTHKHPVQFMSHYIGYPGETSQIKKLS